jgi:RNA polymerase sigma-70 factor (ECF subfamily)
MVVHAQTTHVSLLAALAEGRRDAAWVQFCDRYGDLIRAFAQRQGVQPADCEDVLQDVLLALTQSMPEFRYDPAKGHFRGYLKTVTLHVIFKKLRRIADCRPAGELDSEAADAPHATAAEEAWELEWRNHHIRRAMRTIEAEFNEKDRMAFHHYAVAGSHAQRTAELLGLSVDQVHQAKSRITRRLSELIELQVEEEG